MKNQITEKPTLMVMVGFPYSGKTTWARRAFGTGCTPVVCPDAVRMVLHGQRFSSAAEPLVWLFVDYMIRALFAVGHSRVVLDATNNTARRRARWVRPQFWDTEFVVMDVPTSTCVHRAKVAGDDAIIPVIERMANQYEPVSDSEGGHIRYIAPTASPYAPEDNLNNTNKE